MSSLMLSSILFLMLSLIFHLFVLLVVLKVILKVVLKVFFKVVLKVFSAILSSFGALGPWELVGGPPKTIRQRYIILNYSVRGVGGIKPVHLVKTKTGTW